ncbi:MAG: methanogenesis marker 15 protein [Candidatus Nezhaarchaeota archaeon]|nr:methanogenesis marker 15 protein [Candidatus Nezhaarchaeota archaeon]MCX8141663.1 methanogenesis marker 15 protein [Candidatus Nezhaarchaeota archaeon]MDW8049930.1 methanogenesis marker 15 protein [Nitrososphaerota archaeon]
MTVKIAQISCGTEYSGVQREIYRAAEITGMQIVFPEIDTVDIKRAMDIMGLYPASTGLRVMLARALAIIEGRVEVDGAIIMTCFRCAEGALVRHAIRRFLHEKARIPVISYSFTERMKAENLLLRFEALVNMIERRSLLARRKHEGLTIGIDSGSTMTKGVIMEDGKILATYWIPTTDVVASGLKVYEELLARSGVSKSQVEAIGVTGYGRMILGNELKADLSQEEITVCSKGASYLGNVQEGDATVIDIGGADNKAIAMHNSIPYSFTVGGICAGASGRFLEIAAARLGVDLETFGELALRGDPNKIVMNTYCIVFGMHDLVTALAKGSKKEDVAAAACYSVAEQFFEQQFQEIEVKGPVLQIGGTSLIKGLIKAFEDTLKIKITVPPYPQYAGAVGAALLSSGIIKMD